MPPLPPKSTNTLPDSLKPYDFHGLDFTIQGKEALADCPFCGYDKGPKFSVNVETGQWRCLICGGGLDKGGGGPIDFIRRLWEESDKATNGADYQLLAAERGFEFHETIMTWGLAKSIVDGTWLVPGWGFDYQGKVEFNQLYRYQSIGIRKALMPTPGRKHVLLGMQLIEPNDHQIHVCEGLWDAMHWWEALRSTKMDEEGNLSATSAVDSSLAAGISIVAAPTCSSFPPNVGKVFKGKMATFLYDNDHPGTNKNTGEALVPAGLAGMQRDTVKIASNAADIQYLKWGEPGYDPSLPSGYDLTDCLADDKFTGIALVFNRMEETPLEWRVASAVASGTEVGPKPCSSWRELIQYWRRAMKWTPGLEHALASMLASIASTNSVGDQLWLKIIGPASCGKSTLCEAVSVNKKHVIAKSTIRGFHSGFAADGSNEDHSLVSQVKNRTLVTKDGDTLLQSPNLGQILSEARDVYDSVSRTSYRNKSSRDYEGIRMTWLLCGTSSLRAIDSSELGERFLDCVIMQFIDPDMEDEILWRKVHQIDGQVGQETNEEGASHYSPDLLAAMERTGGYIDWLKENASKVLPSIEFDEGAKRQVVDIGKFVAYMRARPSEHQTENAERELAVRLVSQHARYAKCLAFVLNKPTVDMEIMQRTRQIGLDTARGVVMDIARLVYEGGERGIEFKAVSNRINAEDAVIKKLIRFMVAIGIIEKTAERVRTAYAVTSRMKGLYERIMRPAVIWEYASEYEAP